jgi:hypothetical protein
MSITNVAGAFEAVEFEGEGRLYPQAIISTELVLQARFMNIEQGRDEKDTTYDHFIYDYVGDPNTGHLPVLRRPYPGIEGDVVYSKAKIGGGSYTESGKLVHIRQADEFSQAHPEANYFVATADLTTGEMNEWFVTDIRHPHVYTSFGVHQADLLLSLSKEPTPEEMVSPDGPLTGTQFIRDLGPRLLRLRRREALQRQPHITLSSRGNNFGYEGMHDIKELMYAVAEITRTLGATATQAANN